MTRYILFFDKSFKYRLCEYYFPYDAETYAFLLLLQERQHLGDLGEVFSCKMAHRDEILHPMKDKVLIDYETGRVKYIEVSAYPLSLDKLKKIPYERDLHAIFDSFFCSGVMDFVAHY